LSFSLCDLGDLGGSAVNNRFNYIHRQDAEHADVTQRILNWEILARMLTCLSVTALISSTDKTKKDANDE